MAMITHELFGATIGAFESDSRYAARFGRTATLTEDQGAAVTAPQRRTFEELVNLEELMERIDHDHELLREIFGIFQREFPGLHSDLRLAVANGDLQRARAVAHSLKGMLANLAVTGAAAMAGQMEELARVEDKLQLAAVLVRLDEEMACLLPSITAYLAGSDQ